MDFNPQANRLLVEQVELEVKSSGGIILGADTEQNAQRDTVFGKVIEAGPGYKSEKGIIPMDVKKGDIITYNPRMALKFLHAGVSFDIIREPDVIMTVSGDDVSINTGTKLTQELGNLIGKQIQQMGV